MADTGWWIDVQVSLTDAGDAVERMAAKVLKYRSEHDPETRDSHIQAMADFIVDAYSGMEKALKVIILEFDGNLPVSSESFHIDLLKRAAINVQDVRSPVITKDVFKILDVLRAARHAYRHIYRVNIDPKRVLENANTAETALRILRLRLNEFRQSLEKPYHRQRTKDNDLEQ